VYRLTGALGRLRHNLDENNPILEKQMTTPSPCLVSPLCRRLCALTFLVAATAQAGEERDILYQVSTIDALLAGVYEPAARIDEVLPYGDFGLGTFEALDGELILLDGQVYQAAANGSINLMPPATGTPFITVTKFDSDRVLPAPAGQSFAAFKTWLEGELPSRNIPYAIRVDGRFDQINYRSVPRQTKPYPPLAEASKQQTLFEQRAINGTLIGFWSPAYTKGINVPGFHLHFLSDDRRYGGHVFDFVLAEGTVRLDPTDRLEVKLPMDAAFLQSDLGSDRSAALHKVEQGKPSQ
jgi:acetolactate decarboxylase